MGLRLVAHYYDRIDALIVSGALDAAGVPNFLHGYDLVALQPFREIALGGYRLMVCEEDLAAALDVIHEAQARRSFEGERLSIRPALEVSLLLLLVWGIFFLIRRHSWQDVD
jgi:hypothetical protein